MAATKRPAGINFDKILQSLKDDIQEMKQEYQESSLPISDDNKNLHQFCDRIEFILKFGIRERSVLGSQRDVWQYFCKCLSGRRNIVEGLKIVKANRELKTGVGRSRCFIRYCLVHQCFADVLQQCVDNRNVTSQFYLPEALMHDASLSSSLLGGLYQLCDVPFDLPPTGHDLDVSWPTFARHGSSIWRPPSRTVSMSSLSSFSSLLSEAISYQSPPVHSNMAPVGEDEPTHECPSSPVSPTSPSHTSADTSLKGTLEEVSELHQRLAHLEDDNATLRASCVSLQLKLDQVQQDTTLTSQECAVDKSSSVSPEGTSTDMCEESSHTCSKCSQLSEELLLSQNRCSELENLQQRLENQVKELEKQVQSLESKEKDNLCKISTLEPKLLEAGSNEIDSDGGHITDRVNVKLQESLATDTSLETSSQTEVTEDMERCRQKLAVLEKEYEALQEKCRAAEIEKSTMRSNIHKICEAEEKLRQKAASFSEKEKEYETLQEDLSSLQDKFEERGKLLQIANDRVNQLEKELLESKSSVQDTLAELNVAKKQATEFKDLHEQITSEYKQLKEEILALQQEITDMKFQLSSHSLERDAAVKAKSEKSEALEVAAAQITEHKDLLTKLQEQTKLQQQLSQNERDQLVTQVEKLNRILADRDKECSGLNEHIQEAEVALKSAQKALSDTQSKLGNTEETTAQLNEDNTHLKEKIIQLLREKDALWHANVRLEGAATAAAGRAWMDNKSTHECLGCNTAFSLTRRRHHCRSCGRIFCTGCSDNWINTAASSRRVRVCDDCFSVHAELATIIASPAGHSSSITEATSLPERKPETLHKGRPLPIGTHLPDDEEFSVISDDELQSSRLSSSPSNGSPGSNEVVTETRATTDILTPASLTDSPPTNAEAWVGAGTRVLVPVDLPAGVTLHWHFSSEPKSVSFAVLHQPPQSEKSGDQVPQTSQQRVLIPTTRVASAEGATVKGRLQTKQPGVYTLVFDNSCSRFTAKKVTYSLSLENQVKSLTSASVASSSSPPSQPEVSLPAP